MSNTGLQRLQHSSLSWAGVLFFFFIFTVLRVWLETGVLATRPYFSLATLLFHGLWFASVGAAVTVFIAVMSRSSWRLVANAALLVYPMIFLPILVALGEGQPTDFDFIRGGFADVGRGIASLGWLAPGLNAGMSAEIVLAVLGAAIFVWFATRSVLRMIGAGAGTAVVLMFFLAEPTFFPLFEIAPPVPVQALLFFLVLLLAGATLAPQKTAATLTNLRWDRLTLFFVFFLLSASVVPFESWIELLFGFAPFFFLWGFAVCLNDVEDEEIDRRSNPHRPLIQKQLSKQELRWLAGAFLLLAILMTVQQPVMVSSMVLLSAVLFTMYSLPPFRWRRFLWSILPLTVAETSPLLLGWFSHRTPMVFTLEMFRLWFGLWLTCALIFGVKDLKDVAGDRAGKVRTWLTVFESVRQGQCVLALCLLVAPFVFIVISGWTQPFFWVAASLVGLSCFLYLWFSRRPTETPIFWIYGFIALGIWMIQF